MHRRARLREIIGCNFTLARFREKIKQNFMPPPDMIVAQPDYVT
ncbi:MAG: hypothetical protein ACX93P_09880 [Roseovarius sp.]